MSKIEERKQLIELETQQFELEQRRAKALAVSAFFPRDLKNDVGSAVIVYEMANRMNVPVMEIAQSIYIIHGRPSFSTAFLVARLNESGLIKGVLKTIVSDDGQSAYCEAIDAATGEKLRGMTITMEMARAEGWATKNGSKWKTMPELMLRKRAQSFFIREYYPQVMFGMQTSEEIEDVEALPAVNSTPDVKADIDAVLSQGVKRKEPETMDAEIEEPRPEQPKPQDSIQEAPAPKRMPLRVSKHYPELIAGGFKQSEVKEFCTKIGLHRANEDEINHWFATQNIQAWADWYHGVGHHPHSPEYAEACGSMMQHETAEPMAQATQEQAAPAEVAAQADPQPVPQRAAAGDFEVSNAVVAKYPTFIKMGLRGPDCLPFAKWAGLSADNIDEFMADPGGVQALIEQFYSEAGDVTPRDR